MAYDIRMDCRTADGTKLNTVMLRHAPIDADKVEHLRAAMLASGWSGRAIIMADAGDHHIAFTGTHRLAAAQGVSSLIEMVLLPDDLSADDWAEIDMACDDDDMLAVFRAINAERGDMDDVVDAMAAEIAAAQQEG